GRATSGDIGRKRHVAALLDRLVEYGAMERERQRRLPALALLLDGRVELTEEAHLALLAETQHVARRGLLARLEERAPMRAVEAAMQGRFDFRLRTLEHAAMEASGNDFCLVEHEAIARPQQIGQLAHEAILERRRRPDHQEPRRIARMDWPQ